MRLSCRCTTIFSSIDDLRLLSSLNRRRRCRLPRVFSLAVNRQKRKPTWLVDCRGRELRSGRWVKSSGPEILVVFPISLISSRIATHAEFCPDLVKGGRRLPANGRGISLLYVCVCVRVFIFFIFGCIVCFLRFLFFSLFRFDERILLWAKAGMVCWTTTISHHTEFSQAFRELFQLTLEESFDDSV